jgi:hypothetical protein
MNKETVGGPAGRGGGHFLQALEFLLAFLKIKI